MDKLRAAMARVIGRGTPRWPRRPASVGTVGREHQSGQGLAEYALVLALIAIVAIVSLAFLGGNIADMFWDPISEDFAEVLSRLGI
jgi:Flp pilus assembly pilin Flp